LRGIIDEFEYPADFSIYLLKPHSLYRHCHIREDNYFDRSGKAVSIKTYGFPEKSLQSIPFRSLAKLSGNENAIFE